MKIAEKERLIKLDILSIESQVRHAFNQGYDLGYKEGIEKNKNQPKTVHCKDCKYFEDAEEKVNAVLDKIMDEIIEYKSRKIFGLEVEDLEKGKETALDYVIAIIDQCRLESEDKGEQFS